MKDIASLLKKRILLLDGAMGTMLQKYDLSADDFGGKKYEGCNEYLNIVKPEVVQEIHEGYLEAGADIIETNTFGASSITLSDFDLGAKDYEINKKAASIAKIAAEKFSTPDKPRFVAGSIGPTNKTIFITSNVTFEEMENSYYRQAKGLVDGGVDLLLVETAFDTLNAKAAFNGIHRLFDEMGRKLPVILSVSIERNGTMLAGQDIESAYTAMAHNELLAIGMNCALGPDLMKDHLRTLAGIAQTYVICYPNAGLPREDGSFPLGPKEFANYMKEFIHEGWLNIVGGCCGTTKEHIAELRKVIDDSKRRQIPAIKRTAISGMETLVINEDIRPVIVGERTNVIGSRKFKDLISEEKHEIAAEIGMAQVNKGAQVIDVCLANPDRDELTDTKRFFDLITRKVRVPLMIDSTDAHVIEAALKKTQGKCVINSVNFEDGEKRCNEVIPLVQKYGAAIIFGTIDEDKQQAMATTVEKKLQIAKRAHAYLTERWKIPSEDIIFDTLVFPIATGDKNYVNSAKTTIEAISHIKKELPGVKTILGVSNVSFGLPPSGREVLNSVYLYHATKAGLDLAIVNSEKIVRYASLSEEEKKLAEDLLFNKVDDPIPPFVQFYRGKKVSAQDVTTLPLEERLAAYIVDGRKDGLIEDLNSALKKSKPLEIINGPLMKGMGEVGRLFNDNKLIVSEVLESAEAMKAAVNHLEKFMDKKDSHAKGIVVVATVKGDVHDIGKNLFEIILHNNGYTVHNLGIKVPPETLIEAYQKYKPDVVGLSGLLVKSAHMMVTTMDDFKAAGLKVPVFVGGAALSSKFTATKIAAAYGGLVVYVKDAMDGLHKLQQLLDDKESFATRIKEIQVQESIVETKPIPSFSGPGISETAILKAPDFKTHIVKGDLEEIFDHINTQMLFGGHLGLKGSYERLMEKKDPKALKLTRQVDEVKKYIIEKKLLEPKAIFKFFECNSDGDTIIVYEKGKKVEVLPFLRQQQRRKLCVADYVATKERGLPTSGKYVPNFVD